MNFKVPALNPSVRFWLTVLGITWLLGAMGLGWLVQSAAIVLLILLVSPLLLFWGVRLWLRWNLVQGTCPVCDFEFASLQASSIRCPSCGELLTVRDRQFQRLTPPGTIDITAVEVNAQVIDSPPNS